MSGNPSLSSKQRHEDERFMAAALSFGQRARGRSWPNPSVGALLVKDEGSGPVVVGQGATMPAGGAHAEVQALAKAGGRANGATAYVTLEPCAHYGRTGPCALALVKAGVARVVFGCSDPNPEVGGKGKKILEEAGVEVISGILERECRASVIGHITRLVHARPHIQLKMALSNDGFIGQKGKGQVAISSPESRRLVHAMRAQVDAILVGIGTVLEDDPELTCRLAGLEHLSPVRVVVDSHARLPLNSKLVQTSASTPLWVLVGQGAVPERCATLEAAGAKVLRCQQRNGHVHLPHAMKELATAGITKVMVEGGAHVARALLNDRLIDEAMIFQGAKIIGADGLKPFVEGSLELLNNKGHFTHELLRRVSGDILWRYSFKETS
ncbi:bifunctional diaminohydroxyphosphoribosylaminopyrimidine deaminase/5-amino-6-(5-phosphoribosylamino)uracil reductase RibD [Flexibacterium corallicola]|uniref:bifunctional diaminohydroxyphosphoribosylaminopyrimidine deaminase/5-amino-6-(5-phosphoribosylamino)uracil reductase RibD n=1 Tax=Flexibacterium corallicola TaxID=3037259 RepID=UPI00286EE3E7|nr:bifunctional diaminohydroxyphosphoribosylaminopyrimidine deaminase/5-amino-6-(5-phosphoribosylamino)uracil reductase RibD [Pseudovibrio sp. M1P-2-3]